MAGIFRGVLIYMIDLAVTKFPNLGNGHGDRIWVQEEDTG